MTAQTPTPDNTRRKTIEAGQDEALVERLTRERDYALNQLAATAGVLNNVRAQLAARTQPPEIAEAMAWRLIEGADTLDGKDALTIEWADGSETVETVSQSLGDVLRALDDARLIASTGSRQENFNLKDADILQPGETRRVKGGTILNASTQPVKFYREPDREGKT
jgi:hypothetical protein